MIDRTEFLIELAKQIERESNDNPNNETPEPYRAAGDRLVDAALNNID